MPAHAALSATTGITERVSVDSAGNQGNADSPASFLGGPPAISADGGYVAFRSEASNLVVGDTTGASDVFVHDRLASALDSSIVIHLEEPAPGSVYSGVSNLRG